MRSTHSKKLILATLAWLVMIAACQPSPESRMLAAERYADSGQYRSAVIELRNLLSAQPDNVAARERLAELSIELADYLSAENEYLKVLEHKPDSVVAWNGYGRAILAQGRPNDVVDRVFPSLVRLEPTSSGHVLRGDTLLVMGKLRLAADAYQDAIALTPEYSDGLVGLAAATESSAGYDESAALLDRAVRSDPMNSRAWVSKGNFHARHLQNNAGQEAFRHAIAIERESDPTGILLLARINLISLLIDMQDFGSAHQEVTQLESEFRDYPVAHFLKGRVALGLGDFATATTELQTYVSQVPKDRRAQAVLGTVHFSQSDLLQAEMYLSQAVRANVGGAAARQLLAETQLRLDKPELAMRLLQSSDARGSNDAMLSTMLGRAQAGIGDRTAALEHFERGLASGDADASTMLLISSGMLALGESERAIRVLESIPEGSDDTFRREILLIAAQLSRGDQDGAIAVADELVEKNPSSAMAHTTAGTVLLSAGQDDKAKSHFEKALDLDDRDIGAMFGMTQIWKQHENLEMARSSLERLLAVEPAYVPALFELAVLARSDIHWNRFWTLLDNGLKLMPGNVGLRLFYMEIANRVGEYDRTLAMAKEADELSLSDVGITHAHGVALFRSGAQEQGAAMLAVAASNAATKARYQFDYALAQFELGQFSGAYEAALDFRKLEEDSIEGLGLEVHSLLEMDSTDRARDAFEAFVTGGTADPRIDILNGDIFMAEGKPLLAIRVFEQAAGEPLPRDLMKRLVSAHIAANTGKATQHLRDWIIDHPDDNESRLLFGQLAADSGDASGMVQAYQDVLNRDPDNIMALNNLAWEYALQGRADAISLAEKAHELQPENGSITDTLGWIYYLRGRYADSVEMLEIASRQAPAEAEIQFHLASALVKVNRPEDAKSILVKILATDARFPSRQHAESLVARL